MSMADRDGWIWQDGKLRPWREATTHVLTHTLHYGMGVFEGVRAYKTSRGTVEEQRFDFNGRQLRQTVSMGVAQMKPAMEHYLELLNEADRRLYESKRAGRNRVTG